MCFSVLISIGLGQKLSLHLWILIACRNKQVDKLWKWLTQLHHQYHCRYITVSLWFHFFLIAIWMYNKHLFPLCSPFSRHYSVVLSKMVFRPCLLGPPTLPNIFIHNASNQNYIFIYCSMYKFLYQHKTRKSCLYFVPKLSMYL